MACETFIINMFDTLIFKEICTSKFPALDAVHGLAGSFVSSESGETEVALA